MGRTTWIRRYLTVFAGCFLLLAAVAALKGHSLREATSHGFLWGAISALIFTGSQRYQAGRGRACGWCATPPDLRQS